MTLHRGRWWLAAMAVGFGGVACGRPATEAECEEIVEHIARLQIEAERPARPEVVEAEVSEFKARVREQTRAACVGKPVTPRVLECARAATNAAAVEGCFRGPLARDP